MRKLIRYCTLFLSNPSRNDHMQTHASVEKPKANEQKTPPLQQPHRPIHRLPSRPNCSRPHHHLIHSRKLHTSIPFIIFIIIWKVKSQVLYSEQESHELAQLNWPDPRCQRAKSSKHIPGNHSTTEPWPPKEATYGRPGPFWAYSIREWIKLWRLWIPKLSR